MLSTFRMLALAKVLRDRSGADPVDVGRQDRRGASATVDVGSALKPDGTGIVLAAMTRSDDPARTTQ